MTSSELIHSGELSKLTSGGRLAERSFFLFDHQLIQCKKELLKKSLIYKSRVCLDSISVVSLDNGKGELGDQPSWGCLSLLVEKDFQSITFHAE